MIRMHLDILGERNVNTRGVADLRGDEAVQLQGATDLRVGSGHIKALYAPAI
jgi:hypothetical protein